MIRSVPTGYLSDLIKTALTARVEIVGGSEPNAKGILDKIELAISEDTSEAELEFVAATPGMLGEYKKALPLWQRLPVSYSCESEGILHTVPRDESMTRDDGMVQYGFAPGEEPRVYTADICAEVGHERCEGIKPTIEGYKGKIILCICRCHQFVALELN